MVGLSLPLRFQGVRSNGVGGGVGGALQGRAIKLVSQAAYEKDTEWSNVRQCNCFVHTCVRWLNWAKRCARSELKVRETGAKERINYYTLCWSYTNVWRYAWFTVKFLYIKTTPWTNKMWLLYTGGLYGFNIKHRNIHTGTYKMWYL